MRTAAHLLLGACLPLMPACRCLSLDHVLALFTAVVCERRILFVTEQVRGARRGGAVEHACATRSHAQLSKLTICMEIICYLLCPFYWRHIYITGKRA